MGVLRHDDWGLDSLDSGSDSPRTKIGGQGCKGSNSMKAYRDGRGYRAGGAGGAGEAGRPRPPSSTAC